MKLWGPFSFKRSRFTRWPPWDCGCLIRQNALSSTSKVPVVFHSLTTFKVQIWSLFWDSRQYLNSNILKIKRQRKHLQHTMVQNKRRHSKREIETYRGTTGTTERPKNTEQPQILQLRVQCQRVLIALSFQICCWKNTSLFWAGSTPCLQCQRVGVHNCETEKW